MKFVRQKQGVVKRNGTVDLPPLPKELQSQSGEEWSNGLKNALQQVIDKVDSESSSKKS